MMSSHEKLDEAKNLKEKGTKYFKAEKFDLALKMYKKVLEFIESDAGGCAKYLQSLIIVIVLLCIFKYIIVIQAKDFKTEN